nr:DUF4007 family protein [Fodinibius sp.]NIV11505.1 DUF4007 family protein [Fodinibius sp.]NIY25105.1 DUF4007 family protein [Fodinibius sp.]
LLQPLDHSKSGFWYKIESHDREDIPEEILLFSILDNGQYGNSISFNELLNGYNSVGAVYALNASGLMKKITRIIDKYPFITFAEDAGIRELQFKNKPEKWQILDRYYDK